MPFESALSSGRFVHPPNDEWKNIEDWRNDNWQGTAEKLGEKSFWQISHGLSWDWTRICVQRRILSHLLSVVIVLTSHTLVNSPSSKNLVISKKRFINWWESDARNWRHWNEKFWGSIILTYWTLSQFSLNLLQHSVTVYKTRLFKTLGHIPFTVILKSF
jgi:hypothetical protein